MSAAEIGKKYLIASQEAAEQSKPYPEVLALQGLLAVLVETVEQSEQESERVDREDQADRIIACYLAVRDDLNSLRAQGSTRVNINTMIAALDDAYEGRKPHEQADVS